MSTKFKHAQKKRRWAGTGVEWTEAFLQQVLVPPALMRLH